MQREFIGPLPEAGRRRAHALGQHVAEVLAQRDLVDHGQDGVGIAPLQRHAAGIGGGDEALLIRLKGKGQHAAGGDGVQGVAVAQVVHGGDGVQVIALQVGAKAAEGLILGAFAPHPGVLAFLHLHRFAAADGAGVAKGVLGQDRLGHHLAGGLDRALEPVAAAPVADGVVAKLVGGRVSAGGADEVQGLSRAVVHDVVVGFLDRGMKAFGVSIAGLQLAAHHDGLEVLGAHQRAHAAARRQPRVRVAAGGHAGDLDQVLAGLPDGGAARLGVSLGQQPVVGLELVLAPDVRGVAELQRVAFEPQVGGGLAAAGQDDPVPARKAQLGAPVAA